MTPEEIGTAAKEEYLSNPHYNVKALVNTFVAGAVFVDKLWREKTRWIPIEEKLPPKKSETRQVFVKNDNTRIINWMIVSCFDDNYSGDIDAIQASFTHWREIEL